VKAVGKPQVGDWYAFTAADGRPAAVRIGSVGRRGNIYVGWFFGPFDTPPKGEELLDKTPEEAVWPARFHDLEGDSGLWEKVVAGEPGDPVWPVEAFGSGSEKGPWLRESYKPDDPSKSVGRERIDRETFDALPSGGGVTSGTWIERILPFAFEDPERYRRSALAMARYDELNRPSPPAQASKPKEGPVHTRFYLYFKDEAPAEEAAKRALGLGLKAQAKPSATEGLMLVLAEGELDPDTEFEAKRQQLEALADELGGEYDGHERAVA
jgi:hypothetical protein